MNNWDKIIKRWSFSGGFKEVLAGKKGVEY